MNLRILKFLCQTLGTLLPTLKLRFRKLADRCKFYQNGPWVFFQCLWHLLRTLELSWCMKLKQVAPRIYRLELCPHLDFQSLKSALFHRKAGEWTLAQTRFLSLVRFWSLLIQGLWPWIHQLVEYPISIFWHLIGTNLSLKLNLLVASLLN